MKNHFFSFKTKSNAYCALICVDCVHTRKIKKNFFLNLIKFLIIRFFYLFSFE